MSSDGFDISEGAWEDEVKAVKVFTDREDPQEAFERKVRVLQQNWKSTFYVLCYYGIGGIGKTSFVNKLCRVINGDKESPCRILDRIDCNYIRYDFGTKNAALDKLSILLNFRKQLLTLDKKFGFYRFDSAVLLYAKKTGIDFEKDETASGILENNAWLSSAVTAAGVLPVVGWVAGVLQAADEFVSAAKDLWKTHIDKERYKKHLEEINYLEPSELMDKLHEYFILDMRTNMLQFATKPLVVFLDTYEKYVDSGNVDNIAIVEDHWLRKGRKSVIQSIPGVLWVITGREKLNWAEDDDRWGKESVERPLNAMSEAEKEALAREHLEQHLLGDLSFKDTDTFLRKAGVANPDLREQLHELTNGTPLFLDICVDTYDEIRSRGKEPGIVDFGKDLTQLISRYLANLASYNKEMAYFLAAVGKWTDESVRKISERMHTLREFSNRRYEEFVHHSFIIRDLDGSYYMHETVRKAALKNADKEIVEEVGQIAAKILSEDVATEKTLNSNVQLSEYIRLFEENTYGYSEAYGYLRTAQEELKLITIKGDYNLLYSLSKRLYEAVLKKYPKTGIEIMAASLYASALRINGYYQQALEVYESVDLDAEGLEIEENDMLSAKIRFAHVCGVMAKYREELALAEPIYEARLRTLGEEHPDTIEALSLLAIAYSDLGNPKKSKELKEQVYILRKQVLGEEHPDTLKAWQNLANAYSQLDEDITAKEMKEQVYEARKRIMGEEHPDTLRSLQSLANTYSHLKDENTSKKMTEQVYEARKRILGEEHPETVSTLQSLAISYSILGDEKTAIEMLKRVYEIRKKVLGENHPDTRKTRRSLDARIGRNDMGKVKGVSAVKDAKDIKGVKDSYAKAAFLKNDFNSYSNKN